MFKLVVLLASVSMCLAAANPGFLAPAAAPLAITAPLAAPTLAYAAAPAPILRTGVPLPYASALPTSAVITTRYAAAAPLAYPGYAAPTIIKSYPGAPLAYAAAPIAAPTIIKSYPGLPLSPIAAAPIIKTAAPLLL